MKNISLALTALLLVAVAFLYYKDFSVKKNEAGIAAQRPDSVVTASAPPQTHVDLSSLPKNASVVFINSDSIFAHYNYAKDAKAAGEVKIAGRQKLYEEKAAAFQKEYNDYIDKAGKGLYTKEQGEQIEAGLQKKQQEILEMQQNQDSFLGKIDDTNADVLKKVYEYLVRFNKQHGYVCALPYSRSGASGALGIADSLDVTNAVVEGLNAEYKTSKGK